MKPLLLGAKTNKQPNVCCSSYFDTDIIKWGCRVEFVAQPVQARNRADSTTKFRSSAPKLLWKKLHTRF